MTDTFLQGIVLGAAIVGAALVVAAYIGQRR